MPPLPLVLPLLLFPVEAAEDAEAAAADESSSLPDSDSFLILGFPSLFEAALAEKFHYH